MTEMLPEQKLKANNGRHLSSNVELSVQHQHWYLPLKPFYVCIWTVLRYKKKTKREKASKHLKYSTQVSFFGGLFLYAQETHFFLKVANTVLLHIFSVFFDVFEIEIFCNIFNTFDQLNASLLNESINF